MSASYFDKLGLSPQERRLVVIVGIVVFVVINWWVIFPMFGNWGIYEQKLDDAGKQRDKFNAEISRQKEYETKLKALQQQGSQVASEEAALRLQQDVINQANLTGLGYGNITPVNRASTTVKTNSFFDEASVSVSINTGEKELIDFLVRLADKELLVRAKSMDIGPDPQTQTRLMGNLTLVKSFQRKPPPKALVPAPSAKPATAVPAPPPTTTPPTAKPAAAAAAKPDAVKPESRLPAALGGGTNAPGRSLPKPVK